MAYASMVTFRRDLLATTRILARHRILCGGGGARVGFSEVFLNLLWKRQNLLWKRLRNIAVKTCGPLRNARLLEVGFLCGGTRNDSYRIEYFAIDFAFDFLLYSFRILVLSDRGILK